MKICLGLITNRSFKSQTVISLLELVQNTKYELEIVMANQGFTIAENRAYLAIQALKRKCDYLFTVDDDMTFPKDTLDRLVANDKDICGILAHSRSLNFNYMVTLIGQKERATNSDILMGRMTIPDKLFECEAIGSSVWLIKTSVFEQIEKPWFAFETLDNGMTKMGEDYWFCRQAKKAGFKIWCDPTLTIGHVGDYTY